MKNEGCLNQEEFLLKAREFFKVANEKHISVKLSIKRLIKKDDIEGNAEFDASKQPQYDVSNVSSLNNKVEDKSRSEYPLLIRISYGSHANKTKCSTIVEANILDEFWQDYSNVVKSGMNGLIKKKKKKSKNATSKDKKKKSRKN